MKGWTQRELEAKLTSLKRRSEAGDTIFHQLPVRLSVRPPLVSVRVGLKSKGRLQDVVKEIMAYLGDINGGGETHPPTARKSVTDVGRCC